ncbi:MAG: hypothetical protein A2787_01585 [Omnitrophica WOR_2 bacterium RIFCSPHIGHO2_01_FULL_48_9]|nr:MAG: hypothetical protein A3D10_06150 [Omnitrophica WOR_2 bacterium RIFCSPHIGHO2_02_FULL_48_11]OGX34081.1 MAG: hypothetical protein A2787_01585 [Omnitrophica WOR_2 bacterium RIFCSPHIGHO2_01_FULL_48_9]
MVEPANLTPTEWSKVLDTSADVCKVAERLKRGNYFSWNKVLQQCTDDSLKTLDLGSGRGENSAMLALRGKQTTLFDWSADNINFSKKLYQALGKEARYVQGDVTKPLPFADAEFDVVFSCGVFEYFTNEQIASILKETFRVARKRVIILVPNAYSFFYRLGMWYMQITKKWQWGGERVFTSLAPQFRAAGFDNVKEFTVAAKHSLTFLTMPGGRTLQKIIEKIFNLTDHPKPSVGRQGYLLISVGEKRDKQ